MKQQIIFGKNPLYEASNSLGVELLRTFNCNEINHSSKICDPFVVEDCTSISLKCFNSVKLKNSNVSHYHGIWEKEQCLYYSRYYLKLLDALRKTHCLFFIRILEFSEQKQLNFPVCQYKLLAIVESWLDPSIKNSELFPNNFNVYRSDRTVVTRCGSAKNLTYQI